MEVLVRRGVVKLITLLILQSMCSTALAAKVVSISRAVASADDPSTMERTVKCSNESTHRIVLKTGSAQWCSTGLPSTCSKDRLKIAKQICTRERWGSAVADNAKQTEADKARPTQIQASGEETGQDTPSTTPPNAQATPEGINQQSLQAELNAISAQRSRIQNRIMELNRLEQELRYRQSQLQSMRQ